MHRMNKMKNLLLKKGIKLVCIAIEGGDCIGKGTLSKNLQIYLTENLSSLNTEKRTFLYPILASFPDYNEPITGSEIKERLSSGKSVNQYIMNNVMAENRYNVFYNIMCNLLSSEDPDYNPDVENGCEAIQIVICDRSVFSAITYTLAKDIRNNCTKNDVFSEDLKKLYIEYITKDLPYNLHLNGSGLEIDILNENMFKRYDKVREKYSADIFSEIDYGRFRLYDVVSIFNKDFSQAIPTPDFLVQVNEDFADPRSREAHKFTQDARAERQGKDTNEKDEGLQDGVTEIYYEFRNIYSDIIKETCRFDLGEKKDMFIAFGSNFGNTDYEEKIFDIIKNASFDVVEHKIHGNGDVVDPFSDFPY